MLALYQAEWCPFSSAVREALTELGVDFVAHQVPAFPEERHELREVAGTDEIPVLRTDDGDVYRGTRDIFGYLQTLDPWPYAAAHRQRYYDHAEDREEKTTEKVLEHFRPRAAA
jgi:glutathione S-transferase